MNRKEIESTFELMSQKISNNIGLMDYAAAVTNMRILTENICDIYMDIYDITIEEGSENTLSNRLECIKNSQMLSRQSIDNLYHLKKMGNMAAHEVDSINKEQADYSWKILQEEMDILLDSIQEENLPTGFNSLADEGWKIKDPTSIIRKVEENAIIETMDIDELNVIGVPHHLADFYKKCNIPSFTVSLDSRKIESDEITYEGIIPTCINNIFLDSINVSFVSQISNNEIIKFFASYESKKQNEEIILCEYDKYERIHKGYWFENQDNLVKKLRTLFPEFKELSEIFNNDGCTLFLPSKCFIPYVPVKFGESWIVYDEKGNFCVGSIDSSLSGSVQSSHDEIFESLKYKVETETFQMCEGDYDSKLLEESYKDIFRLNYIRNGLLTYLEKYEDIKDIFDTSTIQSIDTIACDFLEGYLLAIYRNNEGCEINLIDAFKTNENNEAEAFRFPIEKRESSNNYEGLIFDFDEIAIDYKSLIEIIQKGDVSISQDKVNEYSEDKMVNALRQSIRYSNHAKNYVNKFRNEIIKKDNAEKEIIEKEKQAKLEKQKQEIIEKNKKKRAIIIPIVIVVCCVLLIAPCFLLLFMIGIMDFVDSIPKTVNVNDYVNVYVKGYNHCGEMVAEFDIDEFEKDYGKKIKYNEGYKSTVEGVMPYETLSNYFEYDIEGNGSFSNGDTAVLKWDIDEDKIFEVYNCKLKYKDISLKVTDLEDVDLFDAFEGFEYNIYGSSSKAQLEIVSNLNSMGYSGLLYSADKTENISNGDVITISIQTENGSDLSEYCMDRFNAVPKQKKYEITVVGLPEPVKEYSDIPEEKLNEAIEYGNNHFIDMYSKNGSMSSQWRTDYSIEYIGNYFYTKKDGSASSLGLVYKMTDKLSRKLGDKVYSDEVTIYLVIILKDIVIHDNEVIIDYNNVTDSTNKLDYQTSSHDWVNYIGYMNYPDIYKNIVKNNEEEWFIQNNMKE